MPDYNQMGQAKTSFLQQLLSGDVRSVRERLDKTPSFLSIVEGGKSLLHLAINAPDVSYNNYGKEMISVFLNRGLDINTKDESGATVLHYAVQDENYYSKEKTADLLNFGATLEARDNAGRTPMHWAATKGGYRTEPLAYLIAQGANVNAVDEKGVTPLHLAAQRGDVSIIKALLDAHADIHAVTKDGKTVWDFAVAGGQDYQAQVLKAEAGRRKLAEEQRRVESEKAAVPKDPWKLLSPDRVAFSTVERELGYKLTEIFNFTARTYTQITHNLSTKAEGVALKTFDEFTDKTPIEKAHKALERLGGTIPEAAITGPIVEKPKRNLKLPGTTP